MKRKPLALSVIVGLFLACQGASQTQPPPPSPEAVTKAEPATLRFSPRGEALSGCIHGAPVGKIVVHLARGNDGRCRADVSPALVCVAPGGIIRWRIDNGCERLVGTKDNPALALTKPRKRSFYLDSPEVPKPPIGTDPVSILTACEPLLAQVEAGRSFLYCTVRDDAPEGIYKYGLEGQIDPLDPDIEVRRP